MGTKTASASTGVIARPARSAGRFGRRALLKGAAAAGLGLGAAALLHPGAGSLADLVTPQSVSAANPEKLFFFYRESDGFAATGTIAGGNFSTLGVWNPYTYFGAGWTHVSGSVIGTNKFKFYSYRTLTEATAYISPYRCDTVRVDSNRHFWTHLLPTSTSWFYYNFAHRCGSWDSGKEDYPPGSFGPWTQVINVHKIETDFHYPLFYGSFDGSCAIGFDPTLASYGPGYLAKNWSHIVATASESSMRHDILFYDRYTGNGAIGRLTPDSRGLYTIRSYPGGFATGWTHITAAGSDGFLFYNQNTGDGAIGRVEGNGFITTRSYPRAFSTGWTQIAVVGYPR